MAETPDGAGLGRVGDLARLAPYTGEALDAIAFPLGGIGTGTISLGGRGDLRDWEILNEPAKELRNPFSFFALWTQTPEDEPFCSVLEGEIAPPYVDEIGFGVPQGRLAGLPRFRDVTFRGEYPRAQLDLEDPACPLQVRLHAFNPMTPLDPETSSIPAAIFSWRLHNPTDTPLRASVAAVLRNMVWHTRREVALTGRTNRALDDPDIRAIAMRNGSFGPDDHRHASMCLATSWSDTEVHAELAGDAWWDRWHLFWDAFSAEGRLRHRQERSTDAAVGALVLRTTVPPRSEIELPVVLSWYAPNRQRGPHLPSGVTGGEDARLRNEYARRWSDATEVARHVTDELRRLTETTGLYHETLFESTLPDGVLDAVSSQSSTIRTNTCLRLADGTFHAFEGCAHEVGCCAMDCTHVWNYAQTLAFLYPSLERTMRTTELEVNTRPTGNMAFRTVLPLADDDGAGARTSGVDEYGLWDERPAADGQMGCVLKVYRDWQLEGDDDWLRRLWPHVRRTLEYAWRGDDGEGSGAWDPDGDGIMEAAQHTTYDVELFGPNPLCASLYLAALRAGEEMARALDHGRVADGYRRRFERGRDTVERQLWNGAYYVQRTVDDGVPPDLRAPDGSVKYQVGEGCLSDQLMGQWFAHQVGLGHLYDPDHVRTALSSIVANNFRERVGAHANVQRVYALHDEPGLLMCTWPDGDRPQLPFPYCDEVWSGIEYHVAASLVYEGMVEQALDLVRAVRSRYAGHNRNPWDELECGHHYARAMSSWSLLLALSGYRWSAQDGHLAFAPKWSPEDFRCFYSTGSAWGRFRQVAGDGGVAAGLDVRYGTQTLSSFGVTWRPVDTRVEARVDGDPVDADVSRAGDRHTVRFADPVHLPEGASLDVALRER